MKLMTVPTTILLLSLAGPIAAQEARAAADVAPIGAITAAFRAAAEAQTPATSTAQQVPPPILTPPLTPRRRGSMVGYLEDAVIGTKLRVRMERGTGNNSPDRAEFFYAKCGCYQTLPPSDVNFDPDAPGPREGAASNLDFRQAFVQGEFAASDRVSVFAELPIRWIQPVEFLPGTGGGFEDQGGIGDVRAGVKLALASTLSQVVTLQLKAFVPTGDSEKGLGTNHASLEPALVMYHRASDRVAIESQAGLWLPFSGSAGLPTSSEDQFAGPVLFYGIGPSVEIYRRESVRFGPVLELIGWRVLGGFQTTPVLGEANGTNIINLKVGARLSWNDADSIYGGWGRSLTDQRWYEDLLRFEYRRTF